MRYQNRHDKHYMLHTRWHLGDLAMVNVFLASDHMICIAYLLICQAYMVPSLITPRPWHDLMLLGRTYILICLTSSV